MGRRERLISRSILDAVFRDVKRDRQSFLAWIFAFFTLFHLHLARYQAALFKKLRTEIWQLDEEEYKESFRRADKRGALVPVGDLGYSGSTFFTTPNSKYMIKSLPRRFEYTFFKERLLEPYADHMLAHPDSLLVRITDFLHTPSYPLGRILGTAPSHHIVMENILYGKELCADPKAWETYDLKPNDYFFPERDIAGGALVPQSVKDRLVDEFNDKIRVSKSQKLDLVEILDVDTALLQKTNAIDYSLFVVRYPTSSTTATTNDDQIPIVRSDRSNPWRSGMKSIDGKWIYRLVILDFFWARDALQAKAMSGLIKGYNIFDQKGPMSITTTPDEYKKRFMKMIDSIIETAED